MIDEIMMGIGVGSIIFIFFFTLWFVITFDPKK